MRDCDNGRRMKDTPFTTEADQDNSKLATEITDKRGFAARWKFSTRHVDNFIAQGLPHLAVGKRRVRIVVAEADAWMKARFAARRRGTADQ